MKTKIITDPKLLRAVLFLNAMIRDKVREYELLCKRYPQFASEKTLPDGMVSKAGLLEDLETWKYIASPDGSPMSLVDRLLPIEEPEMGTINTITISEPWHSGTSA